MAGTSIAKLFRNGRSQAVRLPREFRFEGTEVRVRRVPGGVLLEALPFDVHEWFARMDALNDGSFFKDGRNQPPAQKRKLFK
jgi:antitoxin VapB